jgi:hypothetical protein
MSRVGKIARLPEQIREQINHRLQDGENGRDIIAWLNASEEVKTVLAREFEGRKINDTNLSAWRLGGYRDWEAQQTALDEARRVMADGGELAKIGKEALADNLAVWLVGRYMVATRKLLEAEDDAEAWKLLRELCHDVVKLRRGEHGAGWLRIEQEKLKLRRQKNAWDRKKAEPEKNPPKPPMSDEEKERAYARIFGYDLESHPTYLKKTPFTPPPAPDNPPAPPPQAASSETREPSVPLVPSIPSPEEAQAQELRQITALAEAGNAHGQHHLGARYRDGFGVPKDLAKAREWLGKAAAQGIGAAKIELHALIMRFGD